MTTESELITELGFCPYCGCHDVMLLPREEWFTIKIGDKLVYENKMYGCLNPDCAGCWQEGEEV